MQKLLTIMIILLTITLYGCTNGNENISPLNDKDNETTHEIEIIVEEPLENNTEIDTSGEVTESVPVKIVDNLPAKQENNILAGNNLNYGLVTTDGEWIVYANGIDTGGNSDRKLYRTDMQLKNTEKLSDDNAEYICLANGWLYYSNLSDKRSLYKIKIDGSKREMLLDGISEYIFVFDDWIYFFNGSDKTVLGSYLCKMKTDGTETTRLDDKVGEYISIVDDWIYFLGRDSYKGGVPSLLYRVKLDGTAKEQLYDSEILQVVVTTDMIYFCNIEDYNNIYKMTLDGQEIEKINNDNSANINVYADWIYYTSIDEEERLYRVKTDGTGKELLYDGRSFAINIVGEWVFFDKVFADYTEQRRMRLDGSDNQFVENEAHKAPYE